VIPTNGVPDTLSFSFPFSVPLSGIQIESNESVTAMESPNEVTSRKLPIDIGATGYGRASAARASPSPFFAEMERFSRDNPLISVH